MAEADLLIIVVLVCIVLGLGAVELLAPKTDCGVDPDDPCLGSEAWHSASLGRMFLFIGAGAYLWAKLYWAAATGRQLRYRRILAMGGAAFGVFLVASLLYDASFP